MNLNRYTKAVVGAFTAAGPLFYAYNVDGHVTSDEWKQIAAAFLVGLVGVWGVKNSDPERGAAVAVEPLVVEDAVVTD